MKLERREVRYSGHVQGVGFRYTVRELANGFEVSGYVRNTPDGRVELVAEGTTEELQEFTDAIGHRMAGYIRDTQVDVRPAVGDVHGFEIRH